jgi:hypothetical protein
MEVRANLVGHCQEGTANKVYIATIRKEDDGSFRVLGKGGAYGKNLREYDKGAYTSLMRATQVRDKLWYDKVSKTSKPYIDIESSNYYGPLTMDSFWLEGFLENKVVSDEDDTVIDTEPTYKVDFHVIDESSKVEVEFEYKGVHIKGWEVVCVDNYGREELFDEDVTYIAESHPDDGFIFVWNKRGEKTECSADRFKDVQLV